MQNKRGRPTDNPKNNRITVRLTNEDMTKLDECVETEHSNVTDIVRKGINLVHSQLNKE